MTARRAPRPRGRPSTESRWGDALDAGGVCGVSSSGGASELTEGLRRIVVAFARQAWEDSQIDEVVAFLSLVGLSRREVLRLGLVRRKIERHRLSDQSRGRA
jgi:hypothetical protein